MLGRKEKMPDMTGKARPTDGVLTTGGAEHIGSSAVLDAKRDRPTVPAKHYNQFTWWSDSSGWTTINDFDNNRIAQFMRELEEHEVVMWCDGFEAGERRGIEHGKTIQKNEVRRILGV